MYEKMVAGKERREVHFNRGSYWTERGHFVARPFFAYCVGCRHIRLWFQLIQGHGNYWSHWCHACATTRDIQSVPELTPRWFAR